MDCTQDLTALKGTNLLTALSKFKVMCMMFISNFKVVICGYPSIAFSCAINWKLNVLKEINQ